jgi:tetratricopeptide (TPR) repeat protein
MLKVSYHTLGILLLFVLWFPDLLGQPTLPTDLKKPKKYEDKLLGAEKSAEKKFKGPRKFIQNTVTHYNWYFNANNKLEQVLERAKLSNKDDFSQLLPFYNYTLERTSGDRTELDSVIYKANTGILTHDLRNYWIDNLYMLIGKAYYFRNDLDSAYLAFQYINYAFSPKEADGYDMPIGSNANEGTNALSVSTKENNSLLNRAWTTPPSRNESFIWQIRTYIARDQMPEAASLIQTLRNDVKFPERLKTDLNEVQALWFYHQKMDDSAAYYLERSLGNATTREEAARWEYLIAQLYELVGKSDLAEKFYERARNRTLDPILEVYAILNSIRQNNDDSVAIKKNIEALRKMGRRDRYQKYRDIVYYTAAQIELERNNVPGAKEMLLKSAAAATENLNASQRTKSFLLLGDLSFEEKNYPDAKRFYDSVNNNDPGIVDPIALEKRKDVLQKIVNEHDVIHRQDSLQQLAAMPAAQREALLKKMVRQLRKQQGLKEEADQPGNAAIGLGDRNKPATDLFASSNDRGDWYFANPSLKSKGYTTFRQTWGNRPNVDNWRRQAAIAQAGSGPRDPRAGGGGADEGDTAAGGELAGALTVEALTQGLPLTPEKLELSEDSVANALVNLGMIYIDQLEEYPAAIDSLEKFVSKYPYHTRRPEALYYLYFAYRKTGRDTDAANARAELDKKYAGTGMQQMLENALTGSEKKQKEETTKAYEHVYNLFIEGNFKEAIEQKKINDSIYGSRYWTPQLLYIESVYFMHSRQDEEATKVLNNIIETYPDDPMAQKAKNILEVLGRRTEIEDYLTKLEIKREEDTVLVMNQPQKPGERIGTPMEQDSTTLRPVNLNNIDSNTTGRKDITVVAPPPVVKKDTAAEIPSHFTFNVEAPHSVVIVLTKVDPVYVSESRNAFNRYNQQNFYNEKIDINNDIFNDSVRLVVMSGFTNAATAMQYLQQTEPVAATQIVPWLPAGKLTFLLISNDNLEVLKKNQDMHEYLEFAKRYKL